MDDVKYLAGVQAQINGSGTSSGAFQMTVNQFSKRNLFKFVNVTGTDWVPTVP